MNILDIEVYLENFSNRKFDEVYENQISNYLKKTKINFVKQNNEPDAKYCLVLESILKIQNRYLNAFKEFKNKKYYEGWCSLERCEIDLKFLSPHFQINKTNKYWLYFIKNHLHKFQSIFPYIYFLSPEILEKTKICSVCKKQISIRHSCGHEVGEIYSGEYCYRIVTDAEFIGTAFVEKPIQKYSVPFLHNEKTGEKIDQYNYEVIEYLITGLYSPFDKWDVNKSKKRHPHSLFKTYGRNDNCPCGSNKKFKKCCLKKSGVLKTHFQFKFTVPPPKQLQRLKFV